MGAWEGLSSRPSWALEGVADVGGVVGDGSSPLGSWIQVKGEVVETGEAGLIDDGTRHGGESGHGGD